MRKYLISILIGIVIILIIVALTNGIKIGDFQIQSIAMIKENSEELEKSIEKINQKQEVQYKSLSSELEAKAQELKKQKENYADLILYGTQEENSNLNLYEKYEIEYLWTKLGNYATKNELVMKLEVTGSSSGLDKTYNLNFTLSGEYVSIIDCISQIEDDDTLGFKIENFKLVQGENGALQATFSVKNVSIENIDSTISTEIEEVDGNDENNKETDKNNEANNTNNNTNNNNTSNTNNVNNTNNTNSTNNTAD